MGKAMKSFAQWRREESMLEFNFYGYKFKKLMLNMFRWDNLPDNISERFIETKLFYHGMVIFYRNEMGFLQVSEGNPEGFNCYEEPTSFYLHDITGHTEYKDADDVVQIWNDCCRMPTYLACRFFSKRLSGIEKTIDINLEQLKHPVVATCPQSQLDSVRAFMEKVTNGEYFIPVEESFYDVNKFQVLDFKVQNHTQELQDLKHDYENECLTYLGINNVNIDKRERLVAEEATQNNEQILFMKNALFRMRKKAADEINAKFGCNISVTIKPECLEELRDIRNAQFGIGDDDDGGVHSNSLRTNEE